MPSNRFLNHLTVSCWLIRWLAPTLLWARLRLATRSPGRVLQNNQSASRPDSVRANTTFKMEHSHAAVKVHPIDTNRRIILDAQIYVLADPEAEVSCPINAVSTLDDFVIGSE